LFTAGGYGTITIKAPADYQLALDNTTFQSSIVVLEADALAGKTVYARFSPSTKALSISGSLTITGTGLNQEIGSLQGSSLSKTETFDIVTYNLEFFGSDVKNTSNVEFGPIDDVLQIDNVAKVMNTLNADVYAVQEVSDDAALNSLIQKISINGKTFDKVISPVWSRSYLAPDPNFPPQKLVVIYNTKTTTVKKTRVMFSKLYDEIRQGTTTLPNYPEAGTSFYASGRLPYLVEIETTIGDVKKNLTLINIHARANSGSDIGKYNMRKYDVELLKDSLDVYYPNSNLIILGDYNDDVDESVIAGKPSSFQKMVEDTANYNTLTLDISKAGAFSYLSSAPGSFLDHIIISNKLTADYVLNSTTVYDPRPDVVNYITTTSDHAPVIARFELKTDTNLSTKVFTSKKGLSVLAYPDLNSESFNVVINSESIINLELHIYDILGRSVGTSTKLKGSVGENIMRVNSSKLPIGLYIYTISDGNKILFKDKIVKNK
jgi:endonuclease/exonuclease/phosphatase family metal-dependent hydrolase